MNVKRYIAASLAVFVAGGALSFLVDNVILKSTYDSLKNLWRPDLESKMWIMWVVGFIISFLFAFIFTKGYEGKGVMEGVRFGLLIGLFVSIPMAYGTYVMLAIPYSLALQWFVYGTVEYIIFGIVVALIYRPKTT